jgi:hypothetical protein
MAQSNGGLRMAIEAQLDAMSPRDRMLLSGLLSFFSLVFVLGLVWLVRGAVEDKASRVRTAKDNLEVISAMADEYDLAQQKIKRGEERLQQFKGQTASAYLESVARNNGVIDSLTVNQQGSDVVGTLRQTQYRAELKRVPLEQATNFLHEVETSGYPASVTLARFKASGTPGAKVIDLTLELLCYEIEG